MQKLENRIDALERLLAETRGVGLGRLHIQRRVHTHVTALASILNELRVWKRSLAR